MNVKYFQNLYYIHLIVIKIDDSIVNDRSSVGKNSESF